MREFFLVIPNWRKHLSFVPFFVRKRPRFPVLKNHLVRACADPHPLARICDASLFTTSICNAGHRVNGSYTNYGTVVTRTMERLLHELWNSCYTSYGIVVT